MSVATPNRPVVIIGAGHGGTHLATKLTQAGVQTAPVLLDAGSEVPYERPPLSKDLLKDPDAATPRLHRADFYESKGIDLRLNTRVESIDRESRTVRLADGSSIAYERLVLATGARARALPVPGADLPGVVSLRELDEAREIARRLTPGTRVVIIGGGYIGLEVAAAARKHDCDVILLEAMDRVMSRVTSAPVSEHFHNLHVEHGTRIHLGAGVTGIRAEDDALVVEISNGTEYPADMILVGIGIIPNQEIAAQAGLEVGDGILVDDDARTSDPFIYAIGDVTRFTCRRQGVSLRLECVQNALDQADAAAASMLDLPRPEPTIPWFWTVQYDVRLQTAGVRSPDDEILIRHDPEHARTSVLYLRDGGLAAIDTISALRDFTGGKKLIAARVPIDRTRATDPAIPLADAALTVAH